jgi:hypothetical protein
LREPNLGKTNPRASPLYSLAICFAPSLADSIIFLTLTRLVVVIIFENFSFALFTPPLGDYHLPHVAEEQHSGMSRHLPRRRRRRRGRHGQAGGGTSSAIERVDGAGAPAGDTSGVDLASETKTSIVSPQHANPKLTDDASTLEKDLLGVSFVPQTTVQSAPDATSSPPVDQEVLSVSRSMPFRFSCDPSSDPASVDAFIKGTSKPSGVSYAVNLGLIDGRLDLRAPGFRGR